MPWKRYGNNSYYYRNVRVGHRFRSEYGGGGLLGEVMAEIDAERRTTRRELREADRHDVASFLEEQESLGLDGYFRKVEDLAQTAMGLAGYHRHARGSWRRRRMSSSSSSTTPATLTDPAGRCEAQPSAFAEFIDVPPEELDRRLELARQGDARTLGWLQRVMIEDPTGDLVRMYGVDLSERLAWVLACRAIPEPDAHLARVALMAQVERMGKELAGDRPTALERVLGDRAALCWLSLHSLELQYEREKHNFGPELTEATERRLVRLNRQLNEAVKTLAVCRKLAVPTIRMFVGERQINVLGGGHTSVVSGDRHG
jgi:hypothetical protein